MANYPKKMTDPTEAALSAIQEALNIRDEDDRAEPRENGTVFRPTADEERPHPAAPVFDDDPRAYLRIRKLIDLAQGRPPRAAICLRVHQISDATLSRE